MGKSDDQDINLVWPNKFILSPNVPLSSHKVLQSLNSLPYEYLPSFVFILQVKWWLTFNEPWVVTYLGYGNGIFAPGVKDSGNTDYLAAHTIIKSHAEAWHLYDEKYRQTQNGKIVLSLHLLICGPFLTTFVDGERLCERGREGV